MVELLQPLGCEIQEATGGTSALEQWRSYRPHVILLDTLMPDLTGYQVARQIRLEEHDVLTTIIALTASAFHGAQERVLAVGFDDVVRKPFHQQELLDKIQRHLGRMKSLPTPLMAQFNDGLTSQERSLAGLTRLLTHSQAALSAEWVERLQTAAIQADAQSILELVKDLPDRDVTLGNALVDLVNDFRFDLILEVTQQTINHL
ncbi:MAG: response regulator [Leptolyngbyaceae cyanobacterium SL_7_1]|nr:response regulator [Leptolyngbyaceae cyanobacterium SL_7_1]